MDLADRPVQLAAALTEAGAAVVVVGGVARRLLLVPSHRPRDLDVVVRPGDLVRLRNALGLLEVPFPQRGSPRRASPVTVLTGWGPLDVFVAPWPRWRALTVLGRRLRVATGVPK